MKNVFVTGTFRNEWNRDFNLKLANSLESHGLSTFVPQRDSEQSGNRKKTFLDDVSGIDNAQVVVAVGTRTQTSNWGFEIGYAYRAGIPVIILTDADHAPELMTEGACSEVLVPRCIDEIHEYIRDLVGSVKREISRNNSLATDRPR